MARSLDRLTSKRVFVVHTISDWVEQIGDRGVTRTRDPQIRNLMLYPTELRGHQNGSCKTHNYQNNFNNLKPETTGR